MTLKCRVCGHDNTPDNRFCLNCGSPMDPAGDKMSQPIDDISEERTILLDPKVMQQRLMEEEEKRKAKAAQSARPAVFPPTGPPPGAPLGPGDTVSPHAPAPQYVAPPRPQPGTAAPPPRPPQMPPPQAAPSAPPPRPASPPGWAPPPPPSPPQQPGYGQQAPYGQQTPYPGAGQSAAPPQGGFGAPPPAQGGYGAPPPQGAYGMPPQQAGYGAPPRPQGYSSPPGYAQPGYPAGASSGSLPLAGIGARFVALFLDRILIGVALAILAALLGVTSINPNGTAEENMEAVMRIVSTISFLDFLISGGYFVYFIGSRGQTPGKMLMGIKVVGLNDETITYGAAALRYVGYIVDGMLCGIGGYLFAFFREDRRALHDLMATTKVVSVK